MPTPCGQPFDMMFALEACSALAAIVFLIYTRNRQPGFWGLLVGCVIFYVYLDANAPSPAKNSSYFTMRSDRTISTGLSKKDCPTTFQDKGKVPPPSPQIHQHGNTCWINERYTATLYINRFHSVGANLYTLMNVAWNYKDLYRNIRKDAATNFWSLLNRGKSTPDASATLGSYDTELMSGFLIVCALACAQSTTLLVSTLLIILFNFCNIFVQHTVLHLLTAFGSAMSVFMVVNRWLAPAEDEYSRNIRIFCHFFALLSLILCGFLNFGPFFMFACIVFENRPGHTFTSDVPKEIEKTFPVAPWAIPAAVAVGAAWVVPIAPLLNAVAANSKAIMGSVGTLWSFSHTPAPTKRAGDLERQVEEIKDKMEDLDDMRNDPGTSNSKKRKCETMLEKLEKKRQRVQKDITAENEASEQKGLKRKIDEISLILVRACNVRKNVVKKRKFLPGGQ